MSIYLPLLLPHFLPVAGPMGSTGTSCAGDDAALTVPPSGGSVLMVHSLDYFRSFISDPFIFGRVAANHALSGQCAMPTASHRTVHSISTLSSFKTVSFHLALYSLALLHSSLSFYAL